jgi:hypothetical protein
MWSFFHGWRRKIGVATLVTACALFAAWARGTSTFDRVNFEGNDSYSVFHFSNPRFTYPGILLYHGRITDQQDLSKTEWLSFENRYSLEEIQLMREQHAASKTSDFMVTQGYWERELWLFEVGGTNTGWQIAVPYWSLISPLTLLSAYLILWKRRRAQPSDQPTNPNINSNCPTTEK